MSPCHTWGLRSEAETSTTSATGFFSILCPNIMETKENQSCTRNCFESGVISQHPYLKTGRIFFLHVFPVFETRNVCLLPCVRMETMMGRWGCHCMCPCGESLGERRGGTSSPATCFEFSLLPQRPTGLFSSGHVCSQHPQS